MLYDWGDPNPPPLSVVAIDGRDAGLVSRCDPAEGWLERYVTDSAGQVQTVTIQGELQVQRETVFGRVEVLPHPQTKP